MSIFSLFLGQKSTVKKTVPKPAVVKKVTPAPVSPKILEEAQAKAREIVLEAKDEAFKIKDLARQEALNVQNQITQKRQEFYNAQQEAGKLQAKLEERERLTQIQQTQAEKRLEQIESLKQKHLAALEEISGLTKLEAKTIFLKQIESSAMVDAAKIIKSAEEKAREQAENQAREILVEAMYSGATEYVPEYTVTTIKLPDEETKGRIIGKEGRNIRTFEKVTGVDVGLDEQGVIKLSCFDSVRREIARVALERLIKDGRVHPTHIEEFFNKAKHDIERIMYQEGERLCHAVGIYDLPRDLVAYLGRFKYRTSYGQNMIAHTLEETKIGIRLANEVGANVKTVKLGCLLHDIGKVINDEEGSHVELGVKLLKKYNLPQAVIDCVAQHHEDEEFSSVESTITYIADAISGSRPGARYENYEEYITRLQKLEEIAKSHVGVAESFAIQAGREVRVIVNPDKLTDAECIKLAADIKQEVQNALTFPGTVKITVIRETRASQVAQ